MTYMMVRNRVKDFTLWKEVFDSNAAANREVGLTLINLWRGVDDPGLVFFVLEVADKDRALQFVNDPENAKVGQAAGVIDGEFYFVEDVGGY